MPEQEPKIYEIEEDSKSNKKEYEEKEYRQEFENYKEKFKAWIRDRAEKILREKRQRKTMIEALNESRKELLEEFQIVMEEEKLGNIKELLEKILQEKQKKEKTE